MGGWRLKMHGELEVWTSLPASWAGLIWAGGEIFAVSWGCLSRLCGLQFWASLGGFKVVNSVAFCGALLAPKNPASTIFQTGF